MNTTTKKPRVKADPRTLARIGATVSIIKAISRHRTRHAETRRAKPKISL